MWALPDKCSTHLPESGDRSGLNSVLAREHYWNGLPLCQDKWLRYKAFPVAFVYNTITSSALLPTPTPSTTSKYNSIPSKNVSIHFKLPPIDPTSDQFNGCVMKQTSRSVKCRLCCCALRCTPHNVTKKQTKMTTTKLPTKCLSSDSLGRCFNWIIILK